MTDTGPTELPPILRVARVHRTPADAFAVFTDEIGAWWPLPTHGLFGPEAGGVEFRHGKLIERATDGREAVWGEVVVWEPPDRLVFTWHPGQEPADGSEVQVSFEADGAGTRVIVEHRGWERFGVGAAERRRSYVGPSAWGSVLDEFADCAEPRVDVADLEALAAAYADFFAEAERGGFGSPPDGEWNADQVIAHIALNDSAIIAVCQALVHRNEARFENQRCQDPAALAAWTEATGDRGAAIERARATSRQALAAIARLGPDQLETEVLCHMTNAGELVLDAARPWRLMAIEIQAAHHLPSHTAQLGALRC